MDIIEENERKLYEASKHLIWVIRIEGKDKQKGGKDKLKLSRVVQSGFAVGGEDFDEGHRDGLLMTCGRVDWRNWSDVTVSCRPLGVGGFTNVATVVDIVCRTGMCLLRIADITFDNVVEFGDGNLSMFDRVMLIGHPHVTGLGVSGKVLFPCIEDVDWDHTNKQTCGHFNFDSLAITPTHMLTCNVWNKDAFERLKDVPDLYRYERGLRPNIPIVVCSGLVAGEGLYGGPLLNVSGQVVGMLISYYCCFDIGVHVSAIKTFIRNAATVDAAR